MKRILICEDEEFLVDAYRTKLAGTDFEVDIARDGDEALEKVDSFQPDLIILDLVMPKRNGLEVLRELKSSEKTNRIKIIIASNIDKSQTLKDAMELGAKEYFIKSSISIHDLIGKIERLLA